MYQLNAGSELAQELHRAAVERRKRMAAGRPRAMPPQVVVKHIINWRAIPPRPRHERDAIIYIAPIGPIRVRDMLILTQDALAPVPQPRRITVKKIIQIVASTYGLNVLDIQSARRTQVVVRPRQEAQWLAKRFTTLSLPEIGRQFGGRDHTTILHSVRKIDLLIREHGYEPKALPSVERLVEQYEAEAAAIGEGEI